MMKKIAMTAILATLVTVPALAAEGYLGVQAGQNKMDFTGAKTTTSFGVLGGYAFNEYGAVELAYVDFGSADTDTTPAVSIKGNAVSLSGVGSLPLNPNFSLFAKLGGASSNVETASNSNTKSDLTYGVGVQYNAPRSFGVRLGYDNYKVGNSTTTKDSALTNIAVLFKF